MFDVDWLWLWCASERKQPPADEDAPLHPSLAEEIKRKAEKPIVSPEQAIEVARELFGLQVVQSSVRDLDSYDDRNFYMRATHSRTELSLAADNNDASSGFQHFVLKVHNGIESLNPSFIECQNLAMDAVRSSGVWCPRALPGLDGAAIARTQLPLASGVKRNHAVRCLPFRPGGLLADVELSDALLRQLGGVTARVSGALVAFDHPAAHRDAFIWDLAQAPAARPLLKHSLVERHAALSGVFDEFETLVLPRSRKLRRATIHGDINDQNVLVDDSGTAVLGVIDFGDLSYSWVVNEIAIATAYVLIAMHYKSASSAKGEPAAKGPALSEVDAAVAMTSSYAAQLAKQGMALGADEWAVLPTLIATRITVSLVVGAYSSAQDPTNEYLKLTLLPGWAALQQLRAIPALELAETLRQAATR